MNNLSEWAKTTVNSVRETIAVEAKRLRELGVAGDELVRAGCEAMGAPDAGVAPGVWAKDATARSFMAMWLAVTEALRDLVGSSLDAAVRTELTLKPDHVAEVVTNAIVTELKHTLGGEPPSKSDVIKGALQRADSELLVETVRAKSTTATAALAKKVKPGVDGERIRIEDAVQTDARTPATFAFDDRQKAAMDFADRAIERAMADYRGVADGSFAEFARDHARDAILYCFAHTRKVEESVEESKVEEKDHESEEAGCEFAIEELDRLYKDIPFRAARAFRTASDFGTRVDLTAEDMLSPEWQGFVAAAYEEMTQAIRGRGQFDPALGTLAGYLYQSARIGAARTTLAELARRSPTSDGILKVFEWCRSELRQKLGREVEDRGVLAAGLFTDWIRQVLVGEKVRKEIDAEFTRSGVKPEKVTLSDAVLSEIERTAPDEARLRLKKARTKQAWSDPVVSIGTPDPKADETQPTVDPVDSDPTPPSDPFVRKRVDDAIARLDVETRFIVWACADFDNRSLWLMVNVGRALAVRMARDAAAAKASGLPGMAVTEHDLDVSLTTAREVVELVDADTCKEIKKRFDFAYPSGPSPSAAVLELLMKELDADHRARFEARVRKNCYHAAAQGSPAAVLKNDFSSTLSETAIKKRKSLARKDLRDWLG